MDRRSILFMVLMTVTFLALNHFLFPPLDPSSRDEKVEMLVHNTQTDPFKDRSKSILSEVNGERVARDVEEFYVIQNEYQQLVVSNVRGGIAEINLSFKEGDERDAFVRKTREDYILESDYPDQNRFPLSAYRTYDRCCEKGKSGGYYPLLRRGIPSKYYALSTLNEEDDSPSYYRLTRLEKNCIELEGFVDQARIIKRYSFPENVETTPYIFNVTISIEGEAKGLSLTTGIPEANSHRGDSSTHFLNYRIIRNQKGVLERLSLPKSSMTISSICPDWVVNSNGFFGIIMDPQTDMSPGFTACQVSGEAVPSRLALLGVKDHHAADFPGYEMKIPFRNGGGTYHFRLFAGPLCTEVLEKVDSTYQTDYASTKSFYGWFSFISEPFAKFLFFLMRIFYRIVHSWGITIILLTLALRLMLYPLNAWSIKSTLKMQQLAPQLAKIQEKYKKDPKKVQLEMMNLYREKGVNPLGGCLPLLIQMPFLIGMFDLLKSTFELRGASFIPGWIDDLAAPDVLFSWGTPIWFFGNSLHLLPLILGGVMYFQQKMSALRSRNPKMVTDQQKQQQMMGNMMTIVFTLLFYNFPSGLNIYWLSSMLLGILQQWWMSKKFKVRT